MVFRGKPSKGCATCRQKKIRCDQRVGGCANCERLGLTCPGYRNQLDLMFVNDDPVVLQRAKAEATKSRKDAKLRQRSDSVYSLTPVSEGSSDSNTETHLAVRDPGKSFSVTPVQVLKPSVDECGLGYFYTYHVGIPGTGSKQWSTQSDDELLSAMKALGLAGLSKASHSNQLMRAARSHYGASLQRLNQCLRDPVLAKRDSTLLAILILSGFEAEVGANTKSLQAWVHHINGAATLLDMRGPEQFKNTTGRTLFSHMLFSLSIACMRQAVPIPECMYRLRNELRNYVIDEQHPLWRLTEYGLLLTDFHSAVIHGRMRDPHQIVARALELDSYYIEVFEDMVKIPDWQYKVVKGSNVPDSCLPDAYHIHPHFFTSQHWIFMRTARVYCHEITIKMVKFRSPQTMAEENAKQVAKSTDILFQLQRDIISSMPQYLGMLVNSRNAPEMPGLYHADHVHKIPGFLWSQAPVVKEFTTTIYKQAHTSELPMLRLGGGNGIIFPLQVAGLMSITTKEIRKWVIEVLHFIGKTMGVGQAIVLANTLAVRQTVV